MYLIERRVEIYTLPNHSSRQQTTRQHSVNYTLVDGEAHLGLGRISIAVRTASVVSMNG